MAAIFSQILNMSMTGSVVILLVILARLILKRAPKIFSYALWSVVLFRLLCPVAFTAPVSVLDVVEPEQKETSNTTSIVTYIPATVNTQADFIMVQPDEQQVQAESITEPEEHIQMTPMHAVALVWSAGMTGMMLCSVVQYLGLRRRLVGSVQLKGNIYLADHIDTAFVVGLVQPRIYLPSAVPHKERYFILAHEQHHIRRGDHIIKLLAYLALCIHWFNPLVWLAFVLAGKDMEMSCDEAVIKRLGPDIRADYSASLLRLATHKKILSGMPLAFGEGDTKGRVLNMAKWKKPRIWISIICLILCIIVLVICAVNPSSEYVPIKSMYGESLLGNTYENLTQDEFTAYLQTAYGLDALQNHLVYHNAGSFQIDFQFSKNVEDWQLESAQKLAYDKFYLRDVAKYDLWEYDVWLIEHISEVSECVMFRIFVDDQLKMMGSYPGLNPAELKINDLPEGYFYEIDQNQNIIFVDGLQTVGGITSYPIPDGIYDPEDESFNWLKKLVIPDYEDPNLYYLAGITSGNDGWAADFADELDEAKRTVYRHHTFQVVGDTLYDIWFDRLKISFENASEIRKAVSIPQPPKEAESYMPTVPSNDIITDSQLIQYGSLHFSLPDGMEAADENGSIALTFDGRDIGGIALRHPEQPNSPDAFSESWQAAMGVPEASDRAMGYSGGGSLYADYETTYFPDMPVNRDDNGNIIRDEIGTYVLDNEVTHYFFATATDIYDLWLYINRLPNIPREELLKSCYIEGVTDLASKDIARAEEEEALSKCRAVIEAVQQGSYKIVTQHTSGRNESAVSHEWIYSRNGSDWLSITNVLPMGADFNDDVEYAATNSALCTNGQHYKDTGTEWVEIANQEDSRLPWLADFSWDENIISYQGTIEDSGAVFVMLRVDEKYLNSDEYGPHYFVDFSFMPGGEFVSARLSVNLFQDNQLTIRESLVSLDPKIVNAEIQKEYFNAIA